MEIYREILPESYLLILADDDEPTAEAQLAYALRRASRSGKPSIWIDCSHLKGLSFSVLRVLVRHYRRLQQRRVPLVLCHLDAPMRQLLSQFPLANCLPVVPSLLDAERYCRTHRLALVA